MIQYNKAELEKSNVLSWRKEGYTGKGVTVLVLDDEGDKHDWQDEAVVDNAIKEDPRDEDDEIGHATNVTKVVKIVAPDCKVVIANAFGKRASDGWDILEWIQENKPDLINVSYSIFDRDWFNEIDKLRIPVICATGNGGKDNDISEPAEYDWTIAVGAVAESNMKVTNYSNYEEGKVDCCGFTNIYVWNSRKDRPFMFTGTSCATPFVTGMCALVIQKIREVYSGKIDVEIIRKFIHSNTVNIKGTVRDGNGLFILPDLDNIQIEKYLSKEGDNMSVNNPDKIIIHHSATKDGEVKNFDSIRNHHINVNGWADVGYHYVIENVDGEYVTIKGRAENVAGVHTPGQNNQSIGICLVGDFRQGNPPKGQLEEVAKLIKDIRSRYGELPLYKHSDFTATECPVFDLRLIEELLVDKKVTWQEKQGLVHLESLSNKGIIDSPDYWQDKILENMPVWAILSMIDRITD